MSLPSSNTRNNTNRHISISIEEDNVKPISFDIESQNQSQQKTNNISIRKETIEEASAPVDKDNTLQKTFNVILLGETGVGKTSFVNGCANFLKYESMAKALEKGPNFLVDVSFTKTTPDLKSIKIFIPANTAKGKRNSQNEGTSNSQSKTLDPLIHKIDWEEKGEIKSLNLIDTPGMMDTKGSQVDELNQDKIRQTLLKVGSINAVLILLKPNVPRLILGFRVALDKILTMLADVPSENILFCFTNTQSFLYRPGDTINPLNEILKSFSGKKLTANKSNIFCFDSCSIRQLAEILADETGKINDIPLKATEADWQKNITSWNELLKKIEELTPYKINKTTKSLIVTDEITPRNIWSQCLGNMVATIEVCLREIISKEKLLSIEITQLEEYENGRNQINKEESTYKKVMTDNIQMICNAPKCTTLVKLSDGTIANKPLHKCFSLSNDIPYIRRLIFYAKMITLKIFCLYLLLYFFLLLCCPLFIPILMCCCVCAKLDKREKLRSFNYAKQVMKEKMGKNCTTCRCSIQSHMAWNSQFVRVKEDYSEQEAAKKLAKLNSDIDRATKEKNNIESELKTLHQKHFDLVSNAAEISASFFYQFPKEAVNPFMISLEKLTERVRNEGEKNLVDWLVKTKHKHQEIVEKTLQEIKDGTKEAINVEKVRSQKQTFFDHDLFQ